MGTSKNPNFSSGQPKGHGNCATSDNETCHDRFPLPSPLPEGEGGKVSLREFHVKGNPTQQLCCIPTAALRKKFLANIAIICGAAKFFRALHLGEL